MRKIFNKIKSYRPPKYICYLYFFIPIIVCAMVDLDKENDIWFLLNHGKYVLEYGFPTVEPFSMHQDFSFVMQQWLSAVIFYLSYKMLKQYGLLIVIGIVNSLILYFLYKLCMLLSDNKFRLAILISCITDIFLLIFMIPRPQIFTYLNLIIILYIMELFYKNKSQKSIYLLPLISLLQINLHASMWFMIFLFILPYLVCLALKKIKYKKDNRIYKLLLTIIIMFLLGFINPYGIKNVTYIFNSYGNSYINNLIVEMLPPTINSNGTFGVYSKITFILIFAVISIYILNKKGKLELRHMLLLFGVSFLALYNIRSLSLYIIGAIPFVSSYLKNLFKEYDNEKKLAKENKKQYILIVLFLIVYVIFIGFNFGKEFTNFLEKGVDHLLKNNDKNDIILYTNYDNGSYAEYRGLKPYIDTRAEVFLKSNNKKEDIFKEYYLLYYGLLDYDEFINKYKFTHLIVMKNERVYKDIINDKRYKVIYKEKNYKIFEKIDKIV